MKMLLDSALGKKVLPPQYLAVETVPKSAKNALVGWENGELKIRLNAVPEKGAANQTLIAFLAKYLDVPKSALALMSGETSRHKKILITGIDLTYLQEKLE